ncbi:putative carbonic anhydrase [Phytophthora cinnamomi]|uniref:putative carbonic anhydrase n=1 Tax=Phytophthora cinnamomi TaxID=4785 RepID=UPI003559F542|nr:putative carbonic anhydrase [Phytophthora cinnamomi]
MEGLRWCAPVPIDIKTVVKACKGKKNPLSFSGQCSQYNLTEPHEPLEVDVIGAIYKMAQFHLHAPSGHTVDGKAHDGEMHFVHKSSDGSALLVVGIFLDISPKSDVWLGPVLDALENVNSTAHTKNEAITVQLKASKIGGIYNYAGSLTTPGCDETADWWVVQTPIQISSADFTRLHKDLLEYHITDDGNNARPVQPLNGRIVTRYN